ncbi:MAG: hypothetical protein GY719_26065 [bacterium]|nr:hypothetical protein [bacterium]
MKGPGGVFEAEIQRSIPTVSRGGRRISIEKRHDPPTRGTGGRCRRCKGQLVTICSTCRQAPKGAARFTAKQPYDFEVIAPWDPGYRAMGVKQEHAPVIVFALECKRTATPSLPFSALADHQRKGLDRVAATGGVAGVLWLMELPPPRRGPQIEEAGVAWFIPWAEFVGYEEAAERKSFPAAALVTAAIPVRVDPERGRTRRYWKMRDLLRRFGADV